MSIRVSHLHVKEGKSVSEFSYSENKNFPTRKYMEDNYITMENHPEPGMGLFAILDGHGGAQVSEFCTTAIPRLFKEQYKLQRQKEQFNINEVFNATFQRIDDELKEIGAEDVGTTCCLAFIREEKGKRVCTVGNLGDTRAVVCVQGHAKRVTVDHKASNPDEVKRIKETGGCILQGRVGGQLAITRALGDLAFKSIGAINVPEIQEFTLDQTTEYMIIASDGLWDVCKDDKVIEMTLDFGDTKQMSRNLVQYATKNGSKDNISVLAIKF